MTDRQKIWTGVGLLLFISLFYQLKAVLTPFVIAAVLAYLGDPLMNRLTKLRIRRTLAVSLVFMVIMLSIFLLLFFLIPLLSNQMQIFIMRLPDFLLWIQQIALPWLQQHLGVNETLDIQLVKNLITEHWQQAGTVAATAWKTLSQSGLAFVAFITNLILIPLVTFYLLRDWDNFVIGIKQLLPPRIAPTVTRLWHECDDVLGAFLRGQLAVMFYLGIIYSVGLWIAGLDLALLLGILAGLFAIIPYVGIIIGLGAALIAGLVQYHDVIHLVYVSIVFLLGHLVEAFVLTPWLVGDRIGLHPVAVIFAIFAGGHLFGFTGILLALPIAAVLMVLIRYCKQQYLQSPLYQQS